MNPELLGMSDEELIQWACEHGVISERGMHYIFPSIEVFCASHPVGIGTFVEEFVLLRNCGMSLPKAFATITRRYHGISGG